MVSAYYVNIVLLCWHYKQDPENAELLPDVESLEQKIAEAAKAVEDAESTADKRKAAELKEDLMRLKRVEQIYVRFATSSSEKVIIMIV